MSKKQKKPTLVWNSLTIGQTRDIIEGIISERVNQMTTEICDALIKAHGANHIKTNDPTYYALLKHVRNFVTINTSEKDAIGVCIINADYDIRCGCGDGRFI